MSEPLLVTRHLTKDYSSFRALEDLNLEIKPGEAFGLLGPNGSGKSTSIRLILGFLQPTLGNSQVAGFDSWTQGLEVRRRIAYLPGELRLYDNMTGRELVSFLAKLRGERVDGEIDRLAKRLDIGLDSPLTTMSSGMKRKVALISVLLPRVPLIILDEPTNTLDPIMRGELLEQLAAARDRGQTVLFSSHVLGEVEQICDRVGILQRGKLVHLQTMADLNDGKRVQARFSVPPASGPDGKPLEVAADGRAELEWRGPLRELLSWLSSQAVLDVRLEPLGLAGIYRSYHGGEG